MKRYEKYSGNNSYVPNKLVSANLSLSLFVIVNISIWPAETTGIIFSSCLSRFECRLPKLSISLHVKYVKCSPSGSGNSHPGSLRMCSCKCATEVLGRSDLEKGRRQRICSTKICVKLQEGLLGFPECRSPLGSFPVPVGSCVYVGGKPIQTPHTKKNKSQYENGRTKVRSNNEPGIHSDNHTAPNQISHFLLNMFFSDSSSSSKAFSAANRSSFAFSAGCDGPLSGCLKHSSQDQFLFLPTH